MNKSSLFSFVGIILLSGCASVPAGLPVTPSAIHFHRDDVGRVPADFSTSLTGGGGPVKWVVRGEPASPDGGPVLVQESADDTSYRFPMCIDEQVVTKDVSVEVKFKSISGTVDQAGGIVLRYSPENYYVARVNALEDNVNLFKTIRGNRIKIAEVDTKVTPGQWHTLGFAAHGLELVVTFDGKTVITAKDGTFKKPGKIGLWTKADSVSAFADLRIDP